MDSSVLVIDDDAAFCQLARTAAAA